MFECRVCGEHALALGPPIWVTGNADEAKKFDFKWSEVMQAWVKPDVRDPRDPVQTPDFPQLIDGGVYELPTRHGAKRFVVEMLDSDSQYALVPIEKLYNMLHGEGDFGSHHVEPNGVVYDPDMRPVDSWRQLAYTGILLLGVHAPGATPARVAAVQRVFGQYVRGWSDEDLAHATLMDHLEARADEQDAERGE